MDLPLIIFTHIPRAGGTSMWQAFRVIFGKRVRRVSGKGLVKTSQEVKKLLRNRPNAYDVLGGHVRYGIGKNCTARRYQYFTVLRDPTSVVLSRYYKNKLEEVQERKARQRRGNYEENLRHLQRTYQGPPEEFVQRRKNVLIPYLCGPERTEGQVNREHLELAKENLSREYACFGLVERYDESMVLIAKTFGWQQIPEVEFRNKGANRPQKLDRKVFELGRAANVLDYELYHFAEKLFTERLQAL